VAAARLGAERGHLSTPAPVAIPTTTPGQSLPKWPRTKRQAQSWLALQGFEAGVQPLF
jgi:hypothetical protein